MARLFDNANSDYLSYNGAILSAYPLTIACWHYPDEANTQSVISITDSTDNTQYIRIASATGANLNTNTVNSTGYNAFASSAPVINTWNHYTCVWNSSTLRTTYLDGGNKGTGTDSVAFPSVDRTAIGALIRPSMSITCSGRVAEVGIWNAALGDAEAAILATGASPLMVRPQSLVGYWPLIGRTSPEIDIVGGYDMTLNAAPTVAAHAPVYYPMPMNIGIPAPVGGGTLGRMYSVSNTVAGVTAATDMIEVNAPADAVVVLHKVIITQETEFADAASEQIDLMIHRASTSGSGGATPTASPLEVGDAAFGGTVETGNTSQGTDGTILHREAVNVMAGMYWAPTPEERIVISPSGRVTISLETAPDDSIDFRVAAYFEEIGG